MAKCVALTQVASAVPIVGQELGAVTGMAGSGISTAINGVLQGEPLFIAGLAVGLVVLAGLFKLTRIGASFIAMMGFFVIVGCSL